MLGLTKEAYIRIIKMSVAIALLILGCGTWGRLSTVYAESDGSLTVTVAPIVYTPTGKFVDIPVTVKNNTAADVTGISMIEATYVTDKDGDKWTPYDFQYTTRTGKDCCPAPVNATADELGYTVKAGQTATFYMRVRNKAGRVVGTYSDYFILGKKHREQYYDYDPETNMTSVSTQTIIDAEYTDKIAVTNVVYNPAASALLVGTSENDGTTITPFGSVVDFGTIDLSKAGADAMKQEKHFYVKNVSPVGNDEYGNPHDIEIAISMDSGNDDYGNYCFDFDDDLMNGMRWAPLPLSTESSFSYATGTVKFDANEYIAGTYETNLIIDTSPFSAKLNGNAVNEDGRHVIPVKVKLTGKNKKLPDRVTNLRVTPGNDQVELKWTAPEEGLIYSVYRCNGTDSSSNPDLWTAADWSRYEQVNGNDVCAKDDGTYIFVDGTAKNGNTYSYIVLSGKPFRGYASAPVASTPKSTYISRLLAPGDVYIDEDISGVTVEWEMNDLYGGKWNSGESIVDHFNIYRDGMLVAQIMQNAAINDVNYGWIDDGNGNLNYGVVSNEYHWETFIETPLLGTTYTFNVAAVSKSGVEGYMSEDIMGMGYPKTLEVVGHYSEYGQWIEESTQKTFGSFYVSPEILSFGDVMEKFDIWRAEGNTAPNTNVAPYMTAEDHFVDNNVTPGKAYTYTIMATDYEGNKSNYYTFTEIAKEYASLYSIKIQWSVANGKAAHMEWYGDSYWDDDNEQTIYPATYNIYRNNVLLKSFSGKDYYTFEDDPGSDGTYIYRIDKTVGGATAKGRDYTFVRDTSIVDESTLTKVPGAPLLNVRISDGKPVLEWKTSAIGGEPLGYHIYRKDAGEYVIGYRRYSASPWSSPYDRIWGNNRYLTITDPDTTYLVDYSTNGTYKNDITLGSLAKVDWDETKCPHEYWITAYNSAGESMPSQIFSFDITADEEGNVIIPGNDDLAAPGTPTITGMWVEWEDDSQRYTDGTWDDFVYGRVHVSWEDNEPGGAIDKWNVYTKSAGEENYNNPEAVYYSEVVADSDIKKGDKDFLYAETFITGKEDCDCGKEVKMKVGAANNAGESVSEGKSVMISSMPRFKTVSGNDGINLEWTDLFGDETASVTAWKIYKKCEYDTWKVMKTINADEINYAPEVGSDDVKHYEYKDTDVENGWKYMYKIVAICADGIDRASVVRTVEPEELSEGTERDNIAAQRVNTLITALPKPDEVTLTDSADVNEVKELYDSLTKAQKNLITKDNVDKLDVCLSKLEYEELNANYAAKTAPVQAIIDALPDADKVTLEDEDKIAAARTAFDAIYPTKAKKLVDAGRLTACEAVIKELKYCIGTHGSLTFTGKWMIGEEERPVISVSMYSDKLSEDNYSVGFVKVGTTAALASIHSAGDYYVVVTGKAPYYGRIISKDILKAYNNNDDSATPGKIDEIPDDPENPENPGNNGEQGGAGETKEGGADNGGKNTVQPGTANTDKGEDGTDVGKGASAQTAEKAIISSISEEGPKGSTFAPLLLSSSKQTSNSVKCSWKKVKNAKTYVLYGNAVGKKNKMVKIGTTANASYTVKKIAEKKLKKSAYYKFILVAVDANDKVVSTSKTVFVATTGGKICNYKKITTKAKKDKVTVKAKKTFKLGAKLTKASSKKTVKKYRAISYESSNAKIATVSKKGVIKGVAKGTCYVYVYAQSGVYKKIKVTVK